LWRFEMITESWSKFLFSIWKENREKPKWSDVVELHDEEDRAYFNTLDEGISNGK